MKNVHALVRKSHSHACHPETSVLAIKNATQAATGEVDSLDADASVTRAGCSQLSEYQHRNYPAVVLEDVAIVLDESAQTPLILFATAQAESIVTFEEAHDLMPDLTGLQRVVTHARHIVQGHAQGGLK